MAALSAEKGPLFKVILLGEAGVGKTAIFHRIKENSFSERRKSTVGIDSCSTYVKVGDTQVTLGVWDTAGVERFRTLTTNYYRGTHAAIFVYSVDEPASIHYLSHWIRDLQEYSPDALKVLLGNKTDLESQISTETIELFYSANECGLNALSSAKTGEGIEQTFRSVAEILVQQMKQDCTSVGNVVNLQDSPQKKSICCS